MNKFKDSIKLQRAAIDAMYVLLSEQRLRIWIQCKPSVAERNPVLKNAIHHAGELFAYVNLNITDGAVKNLQFGSDYITFSARFSTIPHDIVVSFSEIMAIYSPDNPTAVMTFNVQNTTEDDSTSTVSKLPTKKPTLTVIK